MKIYLAGKIQKAHEANNERYWSSSHINTLEQLIPGVKLFNPAHRTDDLSDQKSVFGRDMLQVYNADLILVDARDRRGLGVGAEMLFAKTHSRPVISWAPRGSHYNKEKTELLGVEVNNWVHPFVESLSDAIIERLEDLPEAFANLGEVRGPLWIRACMEHYLETNYPQDVPMQAFGVQWQST